MAQSAPGDDLVRLADLEWLDLSDLVRMDEDWRRTLVTIARLHLGVSAVLALTVITYILLGHPSSSLGDIVAIAGIAACVAAIAHFVLTGQEDQARLLQNLRLVVFLSILSVSLMVYLLRDLQGDYYLLYFLPIVSAAGYLGFTGGLLAGVACALAYAVVFWLSPVAITPGALAVVGLRALVFVLVAGLLGLIAERHLSLLNALRASHTQAIQLAMTDSKTGLFNQGYLRARLGSEISRAERSQTPVAFLMVNVHGMDAINRDRGHSAGDAVLQTVGQAIQKQLRATDLPSRWGADEFGVLLYNSDENGAEAVAFRLADDLAQHPPVDPSSGQPLMVGLSQGIAAYPAHTQDKSGAELVDRAFQALQRAESSHSIIVWA